MTNELVKICFAVRKEVLARTRLRNEIENMAAEQDNMDVLTGGRLGPMSSSSLSDSSDSMSCAKSMVNTSSIGVGSSSPTSSSTSISPCVELWPRRRRPAVNVVRSTTARIWAKRCALLCVQVSVVELSAEETMRDFLGGLDLEVRAMDETIACVTSKSGKDRKHKYSHFHVT